MEGAGARWLKGAVHTCVRKCQGLWAGVLSSVVRVKTTHLASLTSSSDNSVIWASFLLRGYSDFHPVPGETLTPLKEQAISTGQLAR